MTARDIRLQANFTACSATYDAPTQEWAVQSSLPGDSWTLTVAEYAPVLAPG